MSEAQIAILHYQELVARGLSEQVLASRLAPAPGVREVLTARRQQIGRLLAPVRARLASVPPQASKRRPPFAAGERGASAS